MASSELVSVSVPHVKAEAQLSVPFTENLHRKSAESLQNLYHKIKENQQLQKIRSFAGSTQTMLTAAPTNLKSRIRSVVSHLQSMRVTSSEPASFYLALVRGFHKLYDHASFTEPLPIFEDYYLEVANQTCGVFTEDEVQTMRRHAFLFFDEVRKQSDDSYAKVGETLLVALAILLDAEFLQGRTRALMNLVYTNMLNERSEKSSPARQDMDEETNASEHNEEMQLPAIEPIDQIQFEEESFLEEFTKKFEEEVTWEELDSKAIAKACHEYHEVAKLNEEERKEGPKKKQELSYLKALQLALWDLLSNLTEKSLQYYEKGLTCLEKHFPEEKEQKEEEEDEEKERAVAEKPKKETRRERLRKLNERLSALITRQANHAYQGSYKALHVKEVQKFLEPYLEAAEPYYKSFVDQGKQVYSFSMRTLVYPVRDGVVLVFNTGAKYYSVVVSKVEETDTYKYIQSKYSDARVSLHSQYLKLDFDNDGVVSLEDCKSTATEVAQTVRDYEYREKGMELYERAKQRVKALLAPSE